MQITHKPLQKTLMLTVFCVVCWLLVAIFNFFQSNTHETWIDVPNADFSLWSAKGKRFDQWNSTSFQRADADKLTYKQFVFYPKEETAKMAKQIEKLPIADLLKKLDNSQYDYFLLRDGRVLASGGSVLRNFEHDPLPDLVIIDPKTKTLSQQQNLQVPRIAHAVVELKDGRVLFIGGQTNRSFADDGSDNKTDTVEEQDLCTGKTRMLGNFIEARSSVIAELINDRDVLIVGGWNEHGVFHDERWWPGAEIFRVPPKIAR